MNAEEIIQAIRDAGAEDDWTVLEVLEDGEALVAMGITDRGAIDCAHHRVRILLDQYRDSEQDRLAAALASFLPRHIKRGLDARTLARELVDAGMAGYVPGENFSVEVDGRHMANGKTHELIDFAAARRGAGPIDPRVQDEMIESLRADFAREFSERSRT